MDRGGWAQIYSSFFGHRLNQRSGKKGGWDFGGLESGLELIGYYSAWYRMEGGKWKEGSHWDRHLARE